MPSESLDLRDHHTTGQTDPHTRIGHRAGRRLNAARSSSPDPMQPSPPTPPTRPLPDLPDEPMPTPLPTDPTLPEPGDPIQA